MLSQLAAAEVDQSLRGRELSGEGLQLCEAEQQPWTERRKKQSEEAAPDRERGVNTVSDSK